MGGAARDSYLLTSPQGSTYDLASWVVVDQGPDFGDSWMAAHYAENPAADGGVLSFESAGVRTMRFPLLMASSGAALGIDLLENETQIRLAARPGATIDIEVAGDQAANPIRFDVLSGRWKPDYKVREQAISIRQGSLELDVQAFGYMPTEILLASAASIGIPGSLAVKGASVIGDVPGLARVVAIPTLLPTTFPAGNWYPDFLGWAFAGASAPGLVASIISDLSPVATFVGDKFAFASQAVQYNASQNATWTAFLYKTFPTAIEPALRDRMRVFVWAQLTPSQALPWYISADVIDAVAVGGDALGSAAPIATLAPAVASGTPGGYGAQPSPAYTLLDLGEISPIASGYGLSPALQLWAAPATTNVGVASPVIKIGGIQLLPLLDDAAGMMPRGLAQPTISNFVRLSGIDVDALSGGVMMVRPNERSAQKTRNYYLGRLPLIGASVTDILLTGGERKSASGATSPIVHAGLSFARVSVSYRPRFAFVRGL